MLFGLSKERLLIVTAYLQTMCLVQAWAKKQAEQDASKPFAFSLQQACDDWVIFRWDLDTAPPHLPPHFSSCEITYMNQRSQMAKLVMVDMPPGSHTIRLINLNLTTSYMASLTCNETLTSNTVSFVTGYPCSQAEMEEEEKKTKHELQRNDTEVSRHPVTVTAASSEYSMTDVALGVFLALCGVAITGYFAYYYWKKRRHRQRIQRIFGQSHLEPFLALHTPSDQPTTSF